MKGELEIIAVIDFVSKLLLTEDYDLKPSPLHTNLSISCDLHCLIRADSSRTDLYLLILLLGLLTPTRDVRFVRSER